MSLSRTTSLVLTALVLGGGAGCGGAETPRDAGSLDVGPPDTGAPVRDAAPRLDGSVVGDLRCEPLVPSVCALPFPSAYFLEDDPSTETGRRVALPDVAVPRRVAGDHPPLPSLAERDGFSVNAGLLVALAHVDPLALPRSNSIARSLEAASATVIVDVLTGERVAHFVDVDERGLEEGEVPDPDEPRLLLLHAAAPLRHARRYAVGIRASAIEGDAEAVASPVFRALRDRAPHEHPYVAERAADFEEVFAALATAGVPRDELVIAWDFETASERDDVGRLVAARDDALARVERDGLPYVIDDVTDLPEGDVARRIDGRMTVPLYLTSAEPGAGVSLGPDGLPRVNGTAEAPFLVLVPRSITPDSPGRPLQFGHGIFGSREAALGEAGVTGFANAHGYVVIAVDWRGMATPDLGHVTSALAAGELDSFRSVPEGLVQGMTEALLAMHLLRGPLASDPALQAGGRPLLDPAEGAYLGHSQGGIYGATYMALSTEVTRGVLDVAGQPFHVLLDRSTNFDPFRSLLELAFESDVDLQIVMVLLQQLWDRAEPGSFTGHLVSGDLAGGRSHEVMLQIALGDHQVSNVTSEIMARSLGVPLVDPIGATPFGLLAAASPHTGAGAIQYDFGLPPIPIGNLPQREGTNPHNAILPLPEAQRAMDDFLRTGRVCRGGCAP